MVKPLKDKFGIEVSERIIRRALQEHEYHYIEPKICQKNLERAAKRLDWCRWHLDNIGIKYFSLMKLQFMLIILQVINGWRKMKSILSTNNRRRGQKLNLWEIFQ